MAKYKIKHPGMYMRVNGKLQQMKKGSEIEVDDKKADLMIQRGFIEAPVTQKQKKVVKKSKKKE